MPKSVSFTSPCSLSSTLWGLTSRWTMPSGLPSRVWAWAKFSARQTSAPTYSDTSGGSGNSALRMRVMIWFRSQPSTSSSTR